MKVFQRVSQRVPFFLIVAFGVYGCGGEGDIVSQRLSGPAENSALPLRIDATPTPTVEPTDDPAPARVQKDDATALAEEPTPTATITPTPTREETATPVTEKDDSTTAAQTPTPTPRPITSPTDAPSAKSSKKVAEEKTPTPQPQHTPTPEIIRIDADEPEDAQEKTDESDSLSPSVRKERPIITPYGITLDKLTVCSSLSNRDPKGASDSFSYSKTKQIYTWMKVSGITPPRIIKHIYYWEGTLVATVELNIKHASMRTWSQKTLKHLESQGKWQVIVTTENEEEVMAVKEFTIVP